jgi:alpha-L-arabinofuranosidase
MWGVVRAANGHPEPFNLKYIEVGNENNFQMSEYVQRYPLFYRAIKEKYPDITIIANADYAGEKVEMVDEHYYYAPQWFINNADKYDSYDRSGPDIYIGEYAVTIDAGNGNMAAALGEAAFMTGMERNSDIVKMASYAPLFVNVNDRRWNPDAIVFDHASSYGTPSYYVQMLFGQNKGDTLVPGTLTGGLKAEPAPLSGGVGVGTWATQVEYVRAGWRLYAIVQWDGCSCNDWQRGLVELYDDAQGTQDQRRRGCADHVRRQGQR